METFLLNVWREVGAYLRYGDAKLAAIVGLSGGLVYAQISRFSLNSDFAVSDIVLLRELHLDTLGKLSLALGCAAVLVGLTVFFPSMTKFGLRTRSLNRIGLALGLISDNLRSTGCVYFNEIAAFKSCADFQTYLSQEIGEGASLSAQNLQVSEQIYIVSSIAASKFVAIYLSAALSAFAFVLFLLALL